MPACFPLLLAAVSLSLKPRRSRLFFGLAGVFFLALALGPATPLHRAVYSLLPLPFQVPARWVLLLNFSLAWLAADGAAALTGPTVPLRRRWLGGAAAALLLALVWMGSLALQAPAEHRRKPGRRSC